MSMLFSFTSLLLAAAAQADTAELVMGSCTIEGSGSQLIVGSSCNLTTPSGDAYVKKSELDALSSEHEQLKATVAEMMQRINDMTSPSPPPPSIPPSPFPPPPPSLPPSPPPPDVSSLPGIRFYSDMQTVDDAGALVNLIGGPFKGVLQGSASLMSNYVSIPDEGGYIELTAHDDLIMPGSQDRTVCMWLRQNGKTFTSGDYIFAFGKHCGSYYSTPGNCGGSTYSRSPSGCAPYGSTFSGRFPNGNIGFMGCGHDWSGSAHGMSSSWTHLCYTYEGGRVKAYKNNILVESHAKALDVEPAASGGIARLGSHVSGAYNLGGDMDEVYILAGNQAGDTMAKIYCHGKIDALSVVDFVQDNAVLDGVVRAGFGSFEHGGCCHET